MPTYRRTFPGRPEEIQQARRWTRTVLNDCPSTDEAALVVTELSTNALLHTASGHHSGAFHVTLARSGPSIAVSVTDSGGTAKFPHVESPDEEDQHGRGLCLVAAVADRVEVRCDQQGGRTITAHLRGTS